METKDNRTARLMALISEQILEVESDFNAQSNLFDAGLDSMAIMQLLMLIEKEFGVRLPSSQLTKEHFSSAEDLARLIAAQEHPPKAGGGIE